MSVHRPSPLRRPPWPVPLTVYLLIPVLVLLVLARANAAAPTMPPSLPYSLPAGAADMGGLFVPADDGGRLQPAPLVATDIDISVSGLVVRTRIEHVFRNPLTEWTEAIYTYPLPPSSAVDRLRMDVGGRIIEGVIEEKQKARRIFTQARRAGRKASLVEQQRPNMFTTSMANLGPGETVRIEIAYSEVLAYRDGGFRLRLPLVVGPRYIPGQMVGAGFKSTGWAAATDQVLDAPDITPPVRDADAGTGNPVTLAVRLDAGIPLAVLESPTHAVAVETLDAAKGRAVVRLKGDAVPADRDFILDWRPKPGGQPRAGLFTETVGGERYALLMLMPPVPKAGSITALPDRPAREVVFIIDTSGSMEGQSMEQAKAALLMALDRLTPRDSFQIIRFSDRLGRFARSAVAAVPANLARARAHVAALTAGGGTEIVPAVATGLRNPSPASGRLRQVVLITDGAVSNETELLKLVETRLGASRLFTVGIGSAPNGYLMTRAARAGRGTYLYIPSAAEVEARMGALFRRLENPALTDIDVRWPKGAETVMWPNPVPDLYAGEPVVVLARLGETSGQVNVSGRLGGALWNSHANLSGGQENPGVAALWGREKIRHLMDGLRRAETRQASRTGIIETALNFRLVSTFTSLVAVDKVQSRPADAPVTLRRIPNNMPDGWSRDAVLGEPRKAEPTRTFDRSLGIVRKAAATARSGVGLANVPRGATPAGLYMAFGLALLVLGLISLWWMRRRMVP